MKVSSEKMLAVIGRLYLESEALQEMVIQRDARVSELEAQVAQLSRPTPVENEAVLDSGVCI